MARSYPPEGATASVRPAHDAGAGPSPYNAGWRRAAHPRGHHDDCPYHSALVARERAEWLRGFAAGRGDRAG
jgi:ribosome modulation factor